MRRVSKRDIGFRFDFVHEVRVPVIHREHRGAKVKLEGVDCHLTLLPDEWRDLARPGVIRAHVSDVPERQGNGWLPKGTRPDTGLFSLPWRSPEKVTLVSEEVHFRATASRYEAFARRYPVGSLVEARVLSQGESKVRLELPGGVITRMATADYVDRWPSRPRMEVSTMDFPEWLEVIVRRVHPSRHVIAVTMHGYPRDPKYCNAASGYRRAYDSREGMFVQSPWDRNTPR